MADGLATSVANSLLDDIVAAYPHVQLHVSSPGLNGSSGVALNTTRQDTTGLWGSAAFGEITTSTAVTWDVEDVVASETYTFFSLWSASSGGTFGMSGVVYAAAIPAVPEEFSIGIGGFVLSVDIAS